MTERTKSCSMSERIKDIKIASTHQRCEIVDRNRTLRSHMKKVFSNGIFLTALITQAGCSNIQNIIPDPLTDIYQNFKNTPHETKKEQIPPKNIYKTPKLTPPPLQQNQQFVSTPSIQKNQETEKEKGVSKEKLTLLEKVLQNENSEIRINKDIFTKYSSLPW